MTLIKKRTPTQEKKWQRNIALVQEYEELSQDKNQSRVELNHYLMEKYGINCMTTIYAIRNKVKQLRAEGAL